MFELVVLGEGVTRRDHVIQTGAQDEGFNPGYERLVSLIFSCAPELV